ncbi:hypothetical protein PTSG_06126 [Salpingoeca rosetta]|uniref:Gamma-soluble NSF attachment protein n=1 Tax=Salpingoeca rosetta (strain ATCC 50818 / BSB-021) TaxID=946362 RepID=F2UC09_SALR5|nr:uncharacterized protein PTSG_06126 [Salpingoeca rosetta]EGD74116.1 hypothetical protein PTSG_06126 [Salpingoeca rosetta]|eukprot:XP_004993017.1 hypothetical protein PTSG_06126 [Salpingoeca rosetta]
MQRGGPKAAEAMKHLEAGEKALKTSMFKWTPEYDIAAGEFEKAGLNFKIAKDYKNAVHAYRRAAECHAHPKCSSTPFHAGKALESAASCAKDMKDPKLSIELIKESAQNYRLTGKNLSACSVLEKAAQQCEQQKDFTDAMELYKDIVELFEEEGKQRQSKRPLERAIACAVKAQDYQAASQLLERQSKLLLETATIAFAYQSGLSQVVVALHTGDFVKADRVFNTCASELNGFGSSEEGRLASQLLEAFESGDGLELDSIKSNTIFKFLIPEVSSLARGLKMDATMAVERAPAQEDQARSALFAPAPAKQQTDEAAKEKAADETNSSSTTAPPTTDAPPPYTETDAHVEAATDEMSKAALAQQADTGHAAPSYEEANQDTMAKAAKEGGDAATDADAGAPPAQQNEQEDDDDEEEGGDEDDDIL